jgi:hypothetical protein
MYGSITIRCTEKEEKKIKDLAYKKRISVSKMCRPLIEKLTKNETAEA